MQDGLRHDVGTIQASSGKGNNLPLAGVGFDTPTLFGTWSNSSFFHNGQAAQVQNVFTSAHGNAASLSAADQTALAEYVRSLDTAAVAPQSPLVRIRSALNNLCVNIRGGSTASGATVVQWTCGNATNEQFTVNTAGGYTQFVAKNSGLCLAQGDTSTSGGPVVQIGCTGGTTTQWTVTGTTLRNRATNTCLDVPGASGALDTALITWPCNGGNNQNWNQIAPTN
jgi:hypothetical protein